MISFFRWRSCRWGREQYWHGVLYHHGIPQRRYHEAQQLGQEFAKLAGIGRQHGRKPGRPAV